MKQEPTTAPEVILAVEHLSLAKQMVSHFEPTGWGRVWSRGEIKALIVMAPELGLAETD